MPVHDLKDQVARLPEQPGVYLWGNAQGETIYVGKARSLRDRVRSYFGSSGLSPRHDALLEEISRLDVIVTDSVMEALALETNLIKQRAPKYNILFRDDKNYPYLRLTTSERFPRVLVARSVDKTGDFYAGPFLPTKLARRTMTVAHRLFGVRSCNEVITGRRGRPCLEYDIKRCIAPCVAEICTEERYQEAVGRARLLLEGRSDELIEQLRARMTDASANERFEEAAELRDTMRTVQTLRDRQQKVATAELGDRDVLGLKVGPSGSVIEVFQVRGGRVVERLELGTDPGVTTTDGEVLQAGLVQFYELRMAPPEVHLPVVIEDADTLEAWLSARAGRRVRIRVPQRGAKRALVDLATRNAELSYRTRFNDTTAAHFDALETLRDVLGLPALPRRIDCFDVSTIQGRDTVAAMVVCEDGRLRRSGYRKFRIRGERARRGKAGGREAPDDLAAMREVIGRRYRAVLGGGGPFPDLIMVDGGHGQVSAAYEALGETGLANLVVVGIAKREELLVSRDRPDPVALPLDDPALLLVQRIRDEAHRFAVTFHRRTRTRRDLSSELDAIAGIGSRRRRALLAAFGSVSGVRRASREELAAVVGAAAAGSIIDYFARVP
jgi:excinuclease ABC subunit C